MRGVMEESHESTYVFYMINCLMLEIMNTATKQNDSAALCWALAAFQFLNPMHSR
jgi:hypothetical protein